MRKNILYLTAAGYVTIILCSLLLPQNVNSSQMYHTIQTNSYYSVSDAKRHFDAIVNSLVETQLEYLRIEKKGKFFTVRLGKFMDYSSARRFLQNIKSKLPNAIVMKTYLNKERIVELYSGSVKMNIEEPDIRSYPVTAHDEAKFKIISITDNEGSSVPLKEIIKNIEALIKKNDYADALGIIAAEIKEQPEHPALNAWFGMVLLKMDKPSESLKYLERATELSPNAPEFHNGLGYSYFLLDRFDEAIGEFNKAISLHPGHFDALTGLCIAYIKNDNKEMAMDVYRKMNNLNKETSKQLLAIINSNFAIRH
ncbi:MAG: tetratricopeptide repeat protein [Nitrospiraceae bacterium]|nr:MAG: tetratricopeptide repeat protein [Nitrospiraceae bacterium]